jgi:hypothetical protein
MDLLLVWTDMLQISFVVLAYLAAAALGAALVRAGWLGRFGGSLFVGLNLALTLAVIVGIVLAGYGNAAGAWTAYVLSIPFMVFVLPYFLGAVLLGGWGWSSENERTTENVPWHKLCTVPEEIR